MEFNKAFLDIDLDGDGRISVEDMELYCDKKKLEKKFVRKWLDLFDTNNDNIIEYDEFCAVLGITNKKMPISPNQLEIITPTGQTPLFSTSDPLKIFRVHMSNDLQVEVVSLVRHQSGIHTKPSRLSKAIVNELNRRHKQYWTCLINIRKDRLIEYDAEGVIFFTPDGITTYLIWRTDEKKRKCGCC